MIAEIQRKAGPVKYVIMHLCSSRGRGDYEAFPTAPMSVDLELSVAGLKGVADRIRVGAGRVCLIRADAQVLLFGDGRMLIERLATDSRAQAAALVQTIIGALD